MAALVAILTCSRNVTAEVNSERGLSMVRPVLLEKALQAEADSLVIGNYLRGVVGAGLLVGAGAFATQEPSTLAGPEDWASEHIDVWRWPTVSGLGVLGVLDGVAFALPEETQWALNDFQMSFMFMGLGIALQGAFGRTTANRVTTGAIFGSGLALGTMELLDLHERQQARRSLGPTLTRIRGGSPLGAAELAVAEQAVRHASHSSAHLLGLGGVLALGGIVAGAPALVGNASSPERNFSKVVALCQLSVATLVTSVWALSGSRYDRYVKTLQSVDLAPLGPQGSVGGMLRGTF